MKIATVLKPYFQIEIGKNEKSQGIVYVLGGKSKEKVQTAYKKIVEADALTEQKNLLLKSEKKVQYFQGKTSHIWIVQLPTAEVSASESTYTYVRDQLGSLVSQFKTYQLDSISLILEHVDVQAARAGVIGLELAAYNFLQCYKGTDAKFPRVTLQVAGSADKKINRQFLKDAQDEALAVQWARHLVNLPPNVVNPESVEQFVKSVFGKSAGVKLEVWDHKKLKAEGMGLHLAVGMGSDTPPRMIRICYRPKTKSSKKPIAFVGKGITFDTGGLDIKPSSAMRLMKKDMGGSAAVLGLAYWVINSGYKRACDFYLALAENSVDAKAMRPGDIYKSRAGHLVEIDNTDAEGRLVLADVMDVAATQKGKDAPEFLIDVATLTGAIKVALGTDIAGLFSNDDQLAQELQSAGQAAGDYSWRMPLHQKYFTSLSSSFADFRNSADGFGGAITAALFLEKYSGGVKWAHLDVYSWNDRPNGALTTVGGSGQPVQALIEWLKQKV
ncbi:leucyl aminopeptidase family protein [Pseudobdellovibrio exovorus]|uniref:Cytosol aminopeptidase n=1 Tax=Pseudobdellovibrio exovorus JSS TaxID=1184267 RepID=M4V7H6_9BACT|nr:leucyl aminopeptidase family protein [Pseudobdellovibrio exovorus]AGH95158.1 cytosol aminopeptidase [Pseudobdellovibrio exovorus JSS]